MNDQIQRLLGGSWDNHIFPFFWQHGEDEATLREYMEVIEKAGCGAVCVESRPHPDFCGDKWWQDMDVILDEARARKMQVWILDDSHFPTGFANGAMKTQPAELHRQSVCAASLQLQAEAGPVEIETAGMIPPQYAPVGVLEQYVLPGLLANAPHFDDDRLLCAVAFCPETGERLNLRLPESGSKIRWEKPEGDWTVWVIGLSRNCGPHREYINMLDERSCRVLIDAVYEPHWAHYAADFGKTIAGFFSDEPEIGNGHIYFFDNWLGTDQDLPFSAEMPQALRERLGDTWAQQLFLLWENRADPTETARIRYAYMDAVSCLVRKNFSRQLGDWCREHGVRYIGHLIEDNNAHARTGSSLAHYFRGLDGQDMAGIDDIGGQLMPQGEDEPKANSFGGARDGEFYHYMLTNLAASAAAIQPSKHGDAMCELFGAYGWEEGLRLEKYLADHLLAGGINNFVPHAFSPAPFPDSDCPPHFYAHGHNPQYRHFGELMKYLNRCANLVSGGHRIAPAAILYHGEAEWTGKCMLTQKPARKLAEAQIEFDTIPSDVFLERERYRTEIGTTLRVNTQEYRVLVVPYAQYVTAAFARGAAELLKNGFPVIFLDALPDGIADGDQALLKGLETARAMCIEELVPVLADLGLREAKFSPASTYLRAMHYRGETELFFFINEAATAYEGTVELPVSGPCYRYDAWHNCIRPAQLDGGVLKLRLEPLESYLLILDTPDETLLQEEVKAEGEELTLAPWRRSICESIDYPAFREETEVTLPDDLAEEKPSFSGFVRYDSSFELTKLRKLALEISDAYEGVEAFVNGVSAGIQIVPPFRYDLSELAVPGENRLRIEVATTLERWSAAQEPVGGAWGGPPKTPECGSGITGTVRLLARD